MEKSYKVETKGSLWEVIFENGCYSDWDVETHIFSGNSPEEVWEFIKTWAKEEGLGDTYQYGLVWESENRKYQFKELDKWKARLDWDSEYGDVYKVQINRANFIYVQPGKLEEDFKEE